MHGWIIRFAACLSLLGGAAAAGQTGADLIEWNVPGIPEYAAAAAVVCRIDGRDIKARPGEKVYTSSPERLNHNAPPPDIQTSAPAAPDRQGQSYPKTSVTLSETAPRNRDAAPAAIESGNAYAALGEPDADTPRHPDGDDAGIPRVFTFDPDDSPVIIRAVTSPGAARRAMPTRNANVYRRHGGGRQGAEIIDKEPVEPSRIPDNSIMAPAADGRLYRAEVVLPSTARGIGMGSEYASGR